MILAVLLLACFGLTSPWSEMNLPLTDAELEYSDAHSFTVTYKTGPLAARGDALASALRAQGWTQTGEASSTALTYHSQYAKDGHVVSIDGTVTNLEFWFTVGMQ